MQDNVAKPSMHKAAHDCGETEQPKHMKVNEFHNQKGN